MLLQQGCGTGCGSDLVQHVKGGREPVPLVMLTPRGRARNRRPGWQGQELTCPDGRRAFRRSPRLRTYPVFAPPSSDSFSSSLGVPCSLLSRLSSSPEMSYNASALFAHAEAALAAANASERLVFESVLDTVVDTLERRPPAGLFRQVYALAVILGVEIVMMGVSIGMRVWLGRQSRWVFELRQTRFGTYITPNASFA